MSINHYSSSSDNIPETKLWWTQQQQQQAMLMEPNQNSSSTSGPPVPIHPSSWPAQVFYHHQPTIWLNSHTPRDPPSSSMSYPTATPRFNLNIQDEDDEEAEEDDGDNSNAQPSVDDDGGGAATTSLFTQQQGGGGGGGGEEEDEEREPMFEKPLTPSDVGKLNRLVIPKQHAEKYFPLGGGDSGESKGLLLSFEDESGKCWRFRYSYWNSSQSYVLTKGWSRYVKEKRLDAGDVVLFERHRADAQRLFIGWRRGQSSGSAAAHVNRTGGGHGNSSSKSGGDRNSNSNINEVGGSAVGWTRGFYSAHPYPTHHHSLPYTPEYCLHAHAGRGSQHVQNQTKPVGNRSSSRVLRLFGVNMECQPDNDSGTSTPEESSYNDVSSPQGTATQHFYHHGHQPSYSLDPQYHMVRQQPYFY